MVGLRLFDSVAWTTRSASPSWARLASSAGSMVMPRCALNPSSSARTVGVSRTGQRYSAIRVIAAARMATALSGLRREPCPARPWAVSRIQALPRSPVPIG